ncbi:CheR family methyltransferase [Amycolatopsis sp. 195334CR]|uniref:CheR family methyltransferase n=1 Tax=Amycolatopsis sp. 195334CR TaxID=2814588 RepID=UPI001A8F5EB1|nr:CheR family methyltransferase [Amycolatopsis sp. 195334CR]MBN6036860.1 PAS domain S-box protein [Amycolatopsis sp. 195334CR]
MADNQADPEFEAVLLYLKESRGFDFTGYKRTSLARRVQRRMHQVGIEHYADYIDHLQLDVEEFNALFDTILINVTSFFRDPDAWAVLRETFIPALLAERSPEDQIRIWSAGCASGEEAYTLAMAFAEAIGPERFRQRVKIYATDVDEPALADARHAAYSENAVENVPSELRTTYFERQGDKFTFRKDLRRSVIFGRNDLVQDAPISRIDLLVCRNTLMYFNAETQAKILNRLHFALAPRGLLFLGKAEMLLSHSRLFEPVDLKQRLFRKSITSPSGTGYFSTQSFAHDRGGEIGSLDQLRNYAYSTSPVAQMVLTGDDLVALINQQAEQVFGLSHRDVGRPLRDLELSYRPVELRGYVEQSKVERRSIRIKDVEWQRGPGETMWLEIHVNPLVDTENGLLGVAISFHDVTAARSLLDELAHANRQLESAYEELQSTNEELETTNEELQSTVEELETTNEELQSTNEELETMNEELQSTNDELQAINDTLRDRSVELNQVNDFLAAVLTSLRSGVIITDTEMRVTAWNRGAEDLWGIRSEEAIGEHLLNLDIGLPVADLRPSVRAALQDAQFTETLSLKAVNRRGRRISLRLHCGSLHTTGHEIHGTILLMEPEEP